ncbi:AsmA family protein [Gallaecimonas xiamenensis]|uniref:A/G-specific adenine glycosylase n=1 Tax=Gallaecimonas xiamenensis 3-C-1 TaxID=745411 RepID=K2IBL9_9GAMM|nr:AsmA family protein [Gallaecimonas xiamenensis]EKE67291.1 A/G-specific adenine glycosylase [Gallaecimonas xiamenensis 3-C-1]
MKAGKILAILVGLVVLVIGALIAFILTIDPNSYKGEIQKAVADNTGRELRLDGDLSWTFFPSVGLAIEKAALSEPDGFAKGTTAEIGQAKVSVKLLPLLSGSAEVDGLSLANVVVNLKPADPAKAQEPQTPQPGQAAGAPDLSALQKVNLGSISLTNIQVNLLDAKGATSQQLVLDEATLDGFAPGSASSLHARFHTLGAQQLVATLDAQLQFNDQLTQLGLPRLAATAKLSGEGLAKPVELSFATQGQVDLNAATADLQSLQLDLANMVVKGKASAKALFTDPAASGSLSIEKTDLRGLTERLGIALPQRADNSTLSDFALGFDWQYGEQQASLTNLKGNLDQTQLSGNAKVNLKGAVPDLALTLALDKFDADRYLPPASDKPAAKGQSQADTAAEIEPDLSALRGFKAKANLSLGWLKLSHLVMENLQIKASNDRGQLALAPFSAELYQGKVKLDAQVDARKQPARLAVQKDVSGVQIEPLLKDFMQSDKPLLAGTTSAKANITAIGLTPTSLTESLNGSADFQFRDGAVYGVNIAHELRKAGAILKGQSAPDDDTKKTDFAELSGSATFKDGLMHNPDLLLSSPLLRVTGAGDIDLPKKTLDYAVAAKVVSTLKGQDGKTMDELKGITLPIKITGAFDDPKVRPDMDALLKGKAQEKIDEQKDKLKDKLGEKLGDLFKKKTGN